MCSVTIILTDGLGNVRLLSENVRLRLQDREADTIVIVALVLHAAKTIFVITAPCCNTSVFFAAFDEVV